MVCCYNVCFLFSSRRRHTRCALVTGVQTCALPIYEAMSLGSFLLSETSRLRLATGIANIYARDAMAAVAGHDGLNRIYDGRFTLGLGVSHKPMVSGRRNQTYGKPLTAMREYLEGMEKAGLDPKFALADRNVVLAALGPKMLELARDRTKGALPYNVTPEHTAMARDILGPDQLICVEQKIGREHV